MSHIESDILTLNNLNNYHLNENERIKHKCCGFTYNCSIEIVVNINEQVNVLQT